MSATRKSARRRGSAAIKVRVRRKNLNDHYLITPYDLIRGEGIYLGLTPEERIFLAGGLTCADDWETTLERIERWVPAGRNKHEQIRRTLRERGFLSMTKVHAPKGSADGEGGQIEWEFDFYMDPLPPEERDKLQPKGAKRSDGSDPDEIQVDDDGDDSTVPPNPGHGSSDDGTAGQTMPQLSGHGFSGHGSPGPGERGATPYIEKKHLSEETPPPTPRDQPPAPSDDGLKTGGDSSEKPAPAMAAIVAWFVARKPDWDAEAVEEALSISVERGYGSLAEAAEALRGIAAGAYDATEGPTGSPRRLYALPSATWWVDVREAREAAARAARAAGPRCSRNGHERQPRNGCGICAADAKALDDDPGHHPAVASADPDRYLRHIQQRRTPGADLAAVAS